MADVLLLSYSSGSFDLLSRNGGGTERTRTVIGLIDNQVPHLSATVPNLILGDLRTRTVISAVTVQCVSRFTPRPQQVVGGVGETRTL